MENTELKFPNLQKVLIEYGQAVADHYKNSLSSGEINASGELYDSVRYITSFNGNKYEIDLNLKDYWKYIEYGTKPHWPPVDAILNWIRIKPVLPYPDKNGKLPTEKQLAYLIGRKISEEGTKAKNVLQNTIEQINQTYLDKIYDAIDKDLEGIAVVIMNNFTKSW